MKLKIQINRIQRAFWFSIALILRNFIKIKKNRIFCWSYSNRKYACTPRAISEYLIENVPDEYEIYWAFDRDIDTSMLDSRIKIVRKYSVRYLIALYSSHFVFYNSRNNRYDSMFIKKKGQKYIQTWHGPFALKQIEKDAADKLGDKYIKMAKRDSEMCDLMLSNSRFLSKLIYDSFWYQGDILEKCIPRNDVFYNESKVKEEYRKIREKMGFQMDTKIVLYAPTFRNASDDINIYLIDWNEVIPVFEAMLGGKVEVLIRLHPNFERLKGVERLLSNSHVHNVTQAPDILDYLLAADVMISDYTSAMFDFILLGRPCFIYAKDIDQYDRGFYWDINILPFSVAQSQSQLVENIKSFDAKLYETRVNDFKINEWGLDEDGNSCKRLYEWLKSNT